MRRSAERRPCGRGSEVGCRRHVPHARSTPSYRRHLRLTRKLADALNLYECLTFSGVRLVAVSQGVDSESSQAEILFGVHGLIDGVYSRELGLKTHRGMQGRALKAMHTGGRVFGYRSVRGADGAKLEIHEAEAMVVRRMFELYSSGRSLKRIAHLLNAEGVASPQPQKGRVSQSWCVSSVRHILRNRRYQGQIIWNTKRKIRVPGTGKRVYRKRPESEWIVSAAPHLRIVSDEVVRTVARRFETTQRLWGVGNTGLARGQQKQVYLFSGLLRCGECGGSITLVGGRANKSRSEYGCSLHAQRGTAVCSNDTLVRRDHLESQLLQVCNTTSFARSSWLQLCKRSLSADISRSTLSVWRFGQPRLNRKLDAWSSR